MSSLLDARGKLREQFCVLIADCSAIARKDETCLHLMSNRVLVRCYICVFIYD